MGVRAPVGDGARIPAGDKARGLTAARLGGGASEDPPAPLAAANVLFLPVFLVLLVFFIVLVGQTSPKQEKVAAVILSLEKRFPPFVIDRRLQDGDQALASRSGTVYAAERLRGLGSLFAAAIAVAQVDKVTPGRLMEVRLPADSLFLPDTATLRPERRPLLARVVEAMRQELPGERLELEALLAIDDGAPGQGPGPVARAGALARALVEMGVSPRALSIGVERGEAGAARLRFSIRDTLVGEGGG